MTTPESSSEATLHPVPSTVTPPPLDQQHTLQSARLQESAALQVDRHAAAVTAQENGNGPVQRPPKRTESPIQLLNEKNARYHSIVSNITCSVVHYVRC